MSAQDSPPRPAGPGGLRVPRAARKANPEGRMPLLDHIRELRNRVLIAMAAVIVGSIIGWYVFPHIWNFIEKPYCRLNVSSGIPEAVGPHGKNTCHLYMTGLFDSLFLHLKIAIASGVIISSPVWLYQIWAFLAPGLYSRERRWAYFFAGSAVPLFAIGGSVAYFAMTKGLRFLLLLVPKGVVPLITVNTYLSYAMAMLLIFGLAFELPLVLILLNLARVLTHQRFRKWRRMIIFLVFAFAAVATPSPDPISMLLLAVPCVLLVELAEIFIWANDRRRARRPDPYASLDGDTSLDLGDGSRDGVDVGRPGQSG
jgi:sec-independent protein translocase protein TatC